MYGVGPTGRVHVGVGRQIRIYLADGTAGGLLTVTHSYKPPGDSPAEPASQAQQRFPE